MKKTKCVVLFTISLFSFIPGLKAQVVDYEKDFNAFKNQQEKEFNEFKSKADAEFATFLKEAWKKFDPSEPVPRPERPEPVKPEVYVKEEIKTPSVEIKPAGLTLPPIQSKVAPVLVKIPVVAVPFGKVIDRIAIPFYGNEYEIAANAASDISLTSITEKDVAAAWTKLCQADYEQMLADCLRLRDEKHLNDWAYVMLTKQIGDQLYGEQRPNETAFLQMFLLSKSGYKVRLAKIADKLTLMISSGSMIYEAPYITIDNTKYFVYQPVKQAGAVGVYTYKQDFADAHNAVCLNIDKLPLFNKSEYKDQHIAESYPLKIESSVNKNLMNFYKDYPQCDVAVYAKVPMSEELKLSIFPALQSEVKGKTPKEAAGILLDFVQTAFQYKTDREQFGYEKPFFVDEVFYYPYCDCEDRAILYTYLVKNLLGLDAVLLDYPNHIASAVYLGDTAEGDYITLENKKYIICDPTFIGAPVGKSMDRFLNQTPVVIR